MVNRSLRWFYLAALLVWPAALSAKDLAEYQIGDKAEEDIVAPHQLVVVDHSATAALKEREGQRIPAVLRFNPRAPDEAEAAFRNSFAETRSNFLAAVTTAFPASPAGELDLATTRFLRFLNSFQKQSGRFPVGTNLAGLWLRGESDAALESDLAARLREAMRVPVRADVISKEVKVGATVRLVPVAASEALTEKIVQERGVNFAKTNLVSLPRARSELVDGFPPEEHVVAKYLSTFVRPSCEMDEAITGEMRAKRTAEMYAADHYEAGQLIVRRGQIVDVKIKAALDQIKEKTAAGQLEKLVVSDEVQAARDSERARWLGLAMGSTCLLAAVGIWQLARRRTTAALLPARIETSGAWQQRALLAEQRADQAHAAVRAGVVAQLTRWLSGAFVRRLASQRASLLDAQQKAATDMAELEARLEKIQAPLQDRLSAYERRIEELEKELSVKGEENRELIRAKIELIRKQWKIEREKNRLELN